MAIESLTTRESVTYGAVHLNVTNLDRSLGFWRDLIGLRELPSPAGQARLGVGERALIVLHPEATAPFSHGHTGLYHVAIHLPNEVEFARILTRLAVRRVGQSPTDHVFSKATYLHDPDGLMLELTLETPQFYGSVEVGPRGVIMTDNLGQVRSPTAPLDFAAAVAPLAGGDPHQGLPAGTFVGHVHLHVADLERAYGFYRDTLGFQEHSYMTPIGMADLSAGGAFPHRLALNNWNGTSALPAEPSTAGLRGFELNVAGSGVFDALGQHEGAIIKGDGSVTIRDSEANTITVSRQ